MTTPRTGTWRSARHTGAMLMAGVGLMAPLASTLVLATTETGIPGIAGTIALLVVRDLLALAGALTLLSIGGRAGPSMRGLGVLATVLGIVLIVAETITYVSINNIGAGFLLLLAQGALAVVGGVVVVRSRKAPLG